MSSAATRPTASCDLVVRGDFVLPMTAGEPVLHDGAVAVQDGRIVAVGPASEVDARFTAADELRGGIVLPGLVNTHGHAAMVLYRGLGDDLPLETWLQERIWPAESRFTNPETIAAGTELAVAEMLASGTTAFADMYFFQEVVGEVVDRIGMRALLGQAVIGFPTPDAPSTNASFAKAERLAETYRDHPRIDVSMALHAVYTLSPEQLAQGADEAARLGIPLQIHMSETRTEVESCVATHGRTPPELLRDTGVLRQGTICAHGVHLSERDRGLIAESGAGIALNPESNLKLASGIPDVAGLLAAGIPLGLGTDGAASNNDLDLWDAVRLAALLPKGVHLDPQLVPAATAVSLATRGGAAIMGWADRVGTLEVGRDADLCVLDTDATHLTPLYRPHSHLAYATRGSDVLHTVVRGVPLYRDRAHTTLDVERARARVREIAARVAAPGKEPSRPDQYPTHEG